MFPTVQGTGWIQGLDSCLSFNLNVVKNQISGGIWCIVGINRYLKLLERCQTRAMFWTSVIFIAVETWCSSSHSPHTQNSHWLLVLLHRLDESQQSKTAHGKLSSELILSSAESHRFCWMFIVIPFSEHSVVYCTETFYITDTVLSPGNLKIKICHNSRISTVTYVIHVINPWRHPVWLT